jgi:hypothetical protein
MINILNITSDGRVEFSVNHQLFDVDFCILDDDFEGKIYTTKFGRLDTGIIYFVVVNSMVVPYLSKPYIKMLDSENREHIARFGFPSNLLGNYSLIGSTCVAWRTYETFNSTYNSPTIGHLILDDEMYVRFCEHIDSYLEADVILGESKGNINYRNQTGSSRVVKPIAHIPPDYPITHHLDVEIHWIHTRPRKLTFNDGGFTFEELFDVRVNEQEYVEKWKRRAERCKKTEKICLWSTSELFNAHGEWQRKQLVDRFKKTKSRSILLTERKSESFEDDLHIVKYIPDWENFHQGMRDEWGGVLWNNQSENGNIFHQIIKEKFL